MLEALTRKFKLGADVDLNDVAGRCADRLSLPPIRFSLSSCCALPCHLPARSSARFYSCLPICRFTGADLYALCSDAWMAALKRAIARQEQRDQEWQQEQQTGSRAADDSFAARGHGVQGEEEEVVVSHADFLQAVEVLQPSLSVEEVAKYERIRDQYTSQQGR